MNASNSRVGWSWRPGTRASSPWATAPCTGNMAGGYAVIKDLLKERGLSLSRYINEREGREVIPSPSWRGNPRPSCVRTRKDTDSLPPYELLAPSSRIISENGLYRGRDGDKGCDRALVEDVVRRVDANEYKRGRPRWASRSPPAPSAGTGACLYPCIGDGVRPGPQMLGFVINPQPGPWGNGFRSAHIRQ